MSALLNVDKAITAILEAIPEAHIEEISLMDALNRILAETIHSPIDLPPFANSAMDGYAIQALDSKSASPETPGQLKVTMDIPAGVAPQGKLNPGEAARIMTGAPVPEGANAIIPVEDTDSTWSKEKLAAAPETVQIFKTVQIGQHIRAIGENIHTGQQILTAGRILSAADTGILAAIGQSTLKVKRQPRVAILSSGDELLSVEDKLTPGKIRDVNSYTLAALVAQSGGIPIRMPVAQDTPESVRTLFENTIKEAPDMIISSAGVSAGAGDLVRMILEELGEIGFWKINLRPGKPLAFGNLAGIPFFGLPGNPVSAMV
ncbi:MAG: gephyrin-like molybdotransferase Glp, partial [Aggregatilineales bacterium]